MVRTGASAGPWRSRRASSASAGFGGTPPVAAARSGALLATRCPGAQMSAHVSTLRARQHGSVPRWPWRCRPTRGAARPQSAPPSCHRSLPASLFSPPRPRPLHPLHHGTLPAHPHAAVPGPHGKRTSPQLQGRRPAQPRPGPASPPPHASGAHASGGDANDSQLQHNAKLCSAQAVAAPQRHLPSPSLAHRPRPHAAPRLS